MSVRFKPISPNIRNTIVCVSLQNHKILYERTQKNHEIPKILKFTNSWEAGSWMVTFPVVLHMEYTFHNDLLECAVTCQTLMLEMTVYSRTSLAGLTAS